MKALTEKNIACAVYYPIPLHQQHVFAQQFGSLTLPVTEKVASECFSLPIFPELTTEQIDTIVEVIRSAV